MPGGVCSASRCSTVGTMPLSAGAGGRWLGRRRRRDVQRRASAAAAAGDKRRCSCRASAASSSSCCSRRQLEEVAHFVGRLGCGGRGGGRLGCGLVGRRGDRCGGGGSSAAGRRPALQRTSAAAAAASAAAAPECPSPSARRRPDHHRQKATSPQRWRSSGSGSGSAGSRGGHRSLRLQTEHWRSPRSSPSGTLPAASKSPRAVKECGQAREHIGAAESLLRLCARAASTAARSTWKSAPSETAAAGGRTRRASPPSA